MNNAVTFENRPLLNLLIAHMPEAKPLLKQFNLSEVARIPDPVFANDEGIYLTVTGNGSAAMATAVAALAAWQDEHVAPAWLNIGIAGHGSAEVGSGLLINKVRDAVSGDSHFPTPGTVRLPVSALHTVSEVERSYPEAVAYDMEGSAFWEAALAHGQLDQIQLFKIVSDNPQQHVDEFQISAVADLFKAQQKELAELVAAMRSTASEHRQVYGLPMAYADFIKRYHFTATQRVQFEKLLRRWTAFDRPQSFSRALDEFLQEEALLDVRKPASTIIKRLENELRKIAAPELMR